MSAFRKGKRKEVDLKELSIGHSTDILSKKDKHIPSKAYSVTKKCTSDTPAQLPKRDSNLTTVDQKELFKRHTDEMKKLLDQNECLQKIKNSQWIVLSAETKERKASKPLESNSLKNNVNKDQICATSNYLSSDRVSRIRSNTSRLTHLTENSLDKTQYSHEREEVPGRAFVQSSKIILPSVHNIILQDSSDHLNQTQIETHTLSENNTIEPTTKNLDRATDETKLTRYQTNLIFNNPSKTKKITHKVIQNNSSAETQDRIISPSREKPKSKAVVKTTNNTLNSKTAPDPAILIHQALPETQPALISNDTIGIEHQTTVLTYPQYLQHKDPEITNKRRKYAEQDMAQLFHLVNEEKMNASKAAKLLDVSSSTAYRWIQENKRTEDLQEVQTETREIDFNDDHRNFIKSLYKENPSIATGKAIARLNEKFPDLRFSHWSFYRLVTRDCEILMPKARHYRRERNKPDTLDDRYIWARNYNDSNMDYLENCIFIGENDFFIKRQLEDKEKWIKEGKKLLMRQRYMVALSSKGIINLEKVETVDNGQEMEILNDHYFVDFTKRTLDILLDVQNFKPLYIVLPHQVPKSDSVKRTIHRYNYASVFLPDFSRELNPVEHFWTNVRNKLKYTKFTKANISLNEKLFTTINRVLFKDLEKFCGLSLEKIEDCLTRTPFY